MKHLTIIVTLFLSITFIGCGKSGLSVIPVTGTVTYNGSPITDALVTFVPEERSETSRDASATTDADGKFSLRTLGADAAGALAGKYIVLVEKSEEVGTTPEGIPISKPLLPMKYSQKAETPLRAEVQSGKNHVTLELND